MAELGLETMSSHSTSRRFLFFCSRQEGAAATFLSTVHLLHPYSSCKHLENRTATFPCPSVTRTSATGSASTQSFKLEIKEPALTLSLFLSSSASKLSGSANLIARRILNWPSSLHLYCQLWIQATLNSHGIGPPKCHPASILYFQFVLFMAPKSVLSSFKLDSVASLIEHVKGSPLHLE